MSVQILAAKGPNKRHRPWKWLRKRLPHSLYRKGYPETVSRWSFARHCRGSCRGRGGTPHSKYFLFSNVGASHVPNITVQGSMNLTQMGYKGQWNHATTTWRRGVHRAYSRIFAESRRDRPVSRTYRRFVDGKVETRLLPPPRHLLALRPGDRRCERCMPGSTIGGDRRTGPNRIIQYAIYNSRGAWIAKRLKRLWNAGCNIKIIYAVTSRPVLSILRSRAGRGPVPMRQSVVRNAYGEIVKYNHNKWMTITGHWGTSTRRLGVPRLQQLGKPGLLLRRADAADHQLPAHAAALGRLREDLKQRTSRKPSAGRVYSFARMLPGAADTAFEEIPEEPVFGEGIYKYLPED